MKTIEQKAKRVPTIRFAGFEDEWVEKKLDDISDVRDGTHASPLYKQEGYPFVTSKNVKDGSINYDDIQYISKEDYDEINKRSKVDVNDILMGMIGTIGNLALVRTEPSFAIKNVALIKDTQQVFFLYLYHYLQSWNIIEQLSLGMDGGTQKFIALNKIRELNICIPSNKEQQKTGLFLESVSALISLEQKKYDKLTQVKKSMLEKMFPKEGAAVPEIRFASFTGDWERNKLGNMGTTFTGLSGKTKTDFGHGKGKFVTYMNVFLNPVSDPNRTESVEIDNTQNSVQCGDVFFTTSSETPDEVGMSSVWLEKTENTYLNSFCFGYRPTVKIDSFYLAYMLRSNAVRKKITYLAQGISRYNISKNGVMEIDVPLPSIDEQQKIGSYFSHLDSLISLQQRKLEKLKNIKKSLLEKMFV